MQKKLMEIINTLLGISENIHKAYKLKIDLIDFVDDHEKVINLLFQCFIKDEGVDLIYWWLYEDVSKIIYDYDKEIDLTKLEDFVDYIIKYYVVE